MTKLSDSISRIRALLKTPGGPEWKRSDVEDGLKRRLGSSYQCYLSIMEALEQVVKELNNELGLDSAAVQAALQRGVSQSYPVIGPENIHSVACIRQTGHR